MFLEMSDPRPSGTFGGLTKNSSIPVVIDDLNEGLIVVSFSHRDNLFQGVLLQLNRERGIPAGISFPKDYCTGEGKKEYEKDPTQIPPLIQRQTYFQDNGCVPRSLRRVIKPPARYKNSRMSLRPVQRPVLCAKCGSRCEEKAEKASAEPTSVAIEQTITKRKRKGGNPTVPSKKIQTKVLKSEAVLSALKSHIPAADYPILPVIDDPNDFSYESVGNCGILDNVWRRPLAKPLKYHNKNIGARCTTPDLFQCKVTSNGGGKLILKSDSNASISSTVTSYTCNKTSSAPTSNNNVSSSSNDDLRENVTLSNLLDMKPLVPPPLFRITRSPILNKGSMKVFSEDTKSHNLKLCISKLTSAKTFHDDYYGSESPYFSTESVPSSSDPDSSSGVSSNAVSEEPNSDSDAKSRAKGSKGRVRKRNATVPLRFRDQSCVAKDVASFKKAKGLSELPPLPKVKVSKKISEEFPGQSQYQINECTVDGNTLTNPVESSDNTASFMFRGIRGAPCSDSANSEVMREVTPHTNVTKRTEPSKTPVIKITFGSSGNGMVVQIPPKTTHQLENNNVLESKAARKAMKKAKKEARKKHLILSTEPSTEDALSIPILHSSTISSSLSTELNQDIVNAVCNESDHMLGEGEPFLSMDDPDRACTVPKKRKKEKKKKKTKEHKENDLGIISNSRSQEATIRGLFSSSLAPPNEGLNFSILNTVTFTSHAADPNGSGVISKISSHRSPDQDKQQTEADRSPITDSYGVWNSPTNDELESVSESTENVEPHDFPVNAAFYDAEKEGATESLASYYHEQSNFTYQKGNVIWGKLLGCPWWPGKIVDILFREPEDIRAKVAWYKSSSQSFIKFNDLCLFEEFYDTKYTKSRRRGSYQHAVRDALVEVESKGK